MGLDDDIAILAAAPLLGFLGRDALRLVSFAAERRSLAAGERLFSRGDRADGGFIVASGTIVLTPRTGPPVEAGRSALIGRTALFVPGERAADAEAREAAEVMRVAPALMRRLLAEFPDAAAAIRAALAQDLAGFAAGLREVGEVMDTPRP